MTAHAAIAASPKAGTPNRTLMQAMLVSRFAYFIGPLEDPQDFDPRGEGGSPVTQVIGYNGLWFWYDEADMTTGHDGATCIVTTANGGRYKVTGVDLLITSVISKTLITPPDPDDVDEGARPSNGDAYIVPIASTGDWATWTGSIAVWVEARREWFRILPKAGWFVSIPGAARDVVYRYDSVQSAWITGDGATAGDDTIPLSAIQGCGASLTVRVENQTTYAPPGSRKTGATPTMPLGGTASNINDNSDTTTGVTSALGNLTGAAIADRIIARLALASATDLISIEARGVLGSAVSSSNAMGLYYSTDNGANWTQAGAGFTLSATAQNIQRNGMFAGVTDIALVTEAKNWSTATNTLSGLNAYDATVTGSIGDTYIIASPAIGVFAGHENKVARCEVANAFTIYTPQNGDRVFDKALGYSVEWRDTAWVSGSGIWVNFSRASASALSSGTLGSLVTSARTIYDFSPASAPSTASHAHKAHSSVLSYAAKRSGALLRFRYSCFISTISNVPSGLNMVATGAGIVIGLKLDSETAMIAWRRVRIDVASFKPDDGDFEFFANAADALSHDYSIVFFSGSAENDSNDYYTTPATLTPEQFYVEEGA